MRRYRFGAVILMLAAAQFAVRPWLGGERWADWAPDFLLIALLIYSIRTTPGRASVGGFLVGLFADALNPVAFGAGALAHTVVAFLAAWGKAVFFAENLLVSAGFFFAGTMIRDLLTQLSSGIVGQRDFFWQMVVWSPLKAFTTAVVGILVLVTFQRWLEVRIAD